jgi:exonuclease VII small subunit
MATFTVDPASLAQLVETLTKVIQDLEKAAENYEHSEQYIEIGANRQAGAVPTVTVGG